MKSFECKKSSKVKVTKHGETHIIILKITHISLESEIQIFAEKYLNIHKKTVLEKRDLNKSQFLSFFKERFKGSFWIGLSVRKVLGSSRT